MRRRTLLGRTLTAAAALALPATLGVEGYARGVARAAATTEPPLVHYQMPYGQAALQPGPGLARTYDELCLLAALQGIVNRDAPRLYLLGVTGGSGGIDLDAFWWARMGELGWQVAQQTPYMATGLQDLLGIFGHYAGGLVVWDPNVPATQNVASTLAGVLDLLPVAYRPTSGSAPGTVQSLYSELVAGGWKTAVSLVATDGSSLFTGKGTIPGTSQPSTGSAKNDAYQWAKVHYLDTGACSAQHLAYYIDAYWLQVPGAGGSFWNNTLVNHDYFVAKRGFFFDLDPWSDEAPVDDPQQTPGTDAATLKAILASAYQRVGNQQMIDVGGFIPWAFKYTNYGNAGGQHGGVATEWEYAQILSSYNAFMEADALGYSAIANASFTAHFPLQARYAQSAPPDLAALQARGLVGADGSVVPGRYFAFYVGDFDSPAWLYQNIPGLWQNPDRGEVPLSWAFDPNLCLRAGPAMAWTRATASASDTFVAGDSGAGYLNPSGLETPRLSGLPSGMAVWAAHCARFYTQWDLQVTGFIIEGNMPEMRANGFKAYSTFSPGGIAGQSVPAQALIDGMPVLRMALDISGTPAKAAAAIQQTFLPTSGVQFSMARGILESPTWYRTIAQSLAAPASGAGITVVDLVTLMALVAQYELHPPAVAPGQATLGAVGGSIVSGGLEPIPQPDSYWKMGDAGGTQAIIFQAPPHNFAWSYFYLRVDPTSGLVGGPPRTLWLQVRYYDAPAGLHMLSEYDSTIATATLDGAYTPTSGITTTGTPSWQTVTWPMSSADLQGRQNGGADLRIDGWAGLAIDRILLTDQEPTGNLAAPQASGTSPAQTPPPTFSDVSASFWAYSAIEALAGKGIVGGFPNGTFQPNAPVTRAQFAKMIDLTLGLATADGQTAFADVPAGAWYAPYVAAAVQAGIVTGVSPTSFDPNGTVTREQMAVMIARALKLTGGSTLPFSDTASIAPWALADVQAAVAAGYMNGFPDGTFQPLGPTTRAQAAKVLDLALQHA